VEITRWRYAPRVGWLPDRADGRGRVRLTDRLGVKAVTFFAPRRAVPADGTSVAVPQSPAARHGVQWRDRIARFVPLCYLLAAMALCGRLWADPASRIVALNPHDADVFAWFMRYAATAVRHGRLPALITTGMNAPVGVNLMWNTPVLLLGVVLAPVTGLFGPQVSLTVLTTAGFAGSATSLFWVLRRWGVSPGAAALGGAVYGFSPALLQSAMSHYDLQFAVLPPLIIYAGVRLVAGDPPAAGHPAGQTPTPAQEPQPEPPAGRRTSGAVSGRGWRRWSRPLGAMASAAARGIGRLPQPVRAGAWLGLLVAAQIFISEEIALTTALTGLLVAVALAASRPRLAARRLLPAVAGLLTAACVAVALAGYGLWTQFHGPLVQHGALYPPDFYVNDLTGFVTPQSWLFFHTAASAAAAARYQGGLTEYLSYLGWPLIILLVLAAVACWRRAAGRAAAFTLAALELFSLGGHPLVGGKAHPSVDLPWHWIEEIPVIAVVLPDRLSILAAGAAAVLLAMGVDQFSAVLSARSDRRAGRTAGPGRAGRVGHAAGPVLAVAALGCLPLLPRPLPAAGTLPLPAGWSAVFARLHLAAGDRVLVVPVPVNYLTPALRWSADTGQPTAMAGGYFIGPGAGGQAYINGAGIKPTAWYLDELWAAGLPPGSPYVGTAKADFLATGTAHGPGALPRPLSQAQVSADMASWRPEAVVADATPGSPLGRYLSRLLGRPTARAGNVLGWRR
jgi:hypothetical protein